jgi:hypothetical protein
MTAWIESAMRFGTPTWRINLATCDLTVRSSMPSAQPISLLDLPTTSISSTCFSRAVKASPVGRMRSEVELKRSMNTESTRRPHQALIHNPDGLHKLGGRGDFIHIAFGV